ncbi:MAG: hypothetical protein K2G25_03815, partial [Oscillospiraceae bacterium]|nr:hypothetical protein [Oscillospiraceae bacterium]
NQILFADQLKITIETWDAKFFEIVFEECHQLEIYCEPGFEIGSITEQTITTSDDPGSEDCCLLIFYDAWIPEQINMKLRCKNYQIRKIPDDPYKKSTL